jgi:hypothetical protein
MAAADFIPHTRSEYRDWLQNLRDNLPATGATLGLTPAEITAIQTACTEQIARIDAITPVESQLQGLQKAAADGRRSTDVLLRKAIGHWKRLPAWDNQIAARLQAVRTVADFDPKTYKPEFKVKIVAGEIHLDWKKKGANHVAVYARLAGQSTWTQIGADSFSPYIDTRPLAQPGVPEVREYMLRGMIKDNEIGLNSDILRITYSGT